MLDKTAEESTFLLSVLFGCFYEKLIWNKKSLSYFPEMVIPSNAI